MPRLAAMTGHRQLRSAYRSSRLANLLMGDQEKTSKAAFRGLVKAEGSTDPIPFGDDNTQLTSVGEYEVIRRIGGGGMGVVFEARHVRLKRRVAMKLLPRHYISDPVASRRFFREMEAAGQLEHRNIVRATDAGVSNSLPYLVMELVEGMDLSRTVRQFDALPPLAAFEAIEQAAEALSHIHAHGMIHRDIKPSNLLLDRQGIVKVADLGLAHFVGPMEDSDDITVSGDVVGTVDYMAPEQAQNSRIADHRADIYSLGCCLHFLLTGTAVYQGESRVDRLIAHRTTDVPDISQRCTLQLPPSAVRLFEEMVAKDPGHRPKTARDVVLRVRTICEEIRELNARSDRDTGHQFGQTMLPADAGLSSVAKTLRADEPPETPVDSLAETFVVSEPPPVKSGQRRSWLIVGGTALALLVGFVVHRIARPPVPMQIDPPVYEVSDTQDTHVAPPPRILGRHDGAVFRVLFTEDGHGVLSCGSDGTIHVFDIAGNRQHPEMRHEPGLEGRLDVVSVALIPDSPTAVSACYSGVAAVWNWRDGRLVDTFDRHRNRVEGVAWIEGTRVLSTGMDDTMYVWDTETGDVIARLDNEHQGGVRSVAVDTAGQRAVTGDYEGNLFLWDLEQVGSKLPGRLNVFDRPVNVWSVDWVADTDQVAIGGIYLPGQSPGEPLLIVYDVETRQIVREFPGHTGRVNGVCASNDGQRLYSAGENVRGWSMVTGAQLFEFDEHSDTVFAVAESPDGTMLATGGTDGTVRIATLPTVR